MRMVCALMCLVSLTGAVAADHAKFEGVWADLVAGNKRFMAGQCGTRDVVKARQGLTEGQSPKVIVLGCADSRLSPELIFDKNLGEIFVVRSAGNIADKIGLGSIEYAVEHLHSCVIVVLGHEKCGAVAAAAEGGKMPTDNLKEIVKRIDPALKEHRKAGLEGALLAAKGVESNAKLSAAELLKNSPILKKEVAAGKVKIVTAVYHLGSGEVVRVAE
jgi:carbonic anhydrase